MNNYSKHFTDTNFPHITSSSLSCKKGEDFILNYRTSAYAGSKTLWLFLSPHGKLIPRMLKIRGYVQDLPPRKEGVIEIKKCRTKHLDLIIGYQNYLFEEPSQSDEDTKVEDFRGERLPYVYQSFGDKKRDYYCSFGGSEDPFTAMHVSLEITRDGSFQTDPAMDKCFDLITGNPGFKIPYSEFESDRLVNEWHFVAESIEYHGTSRLSSATKQRYLELVQELKKRYPSLLMKNKEWVDNANGIMLSTISKEENKTIGPLL